MTSAQVREAAHLTVALYKFTSEQDIYRKFLMVGVKMEEGVIDPSDAYEFIREDETYITESNQAIAQLRAEIIFLTRGRSKDEELAMWQEERRIVGFPLEKLRELNASL